MGYLPVSYGINQGECEICRICRSEEGCSSVTSFWQGKDKYILKLLLLLAIGVVVQQSSGKLTPSVLFLIGLTSTTETGRRRVATCEHTSRITSFQNSSSSRMAKVMKALGFLVGRLFLP